jgi:hypothetical protein
MTSIRCPYQSVCRVITMEERRRSGRLAANSMTAVLTVLQEMFVP